MALARLAGSYSQVSKTSLNNFPFLGPTSSAVCHLRNSSSQACYCLCCWQKRCHMLINKYSCQGFFLDLFLWSYRARSSQPLDSVWWTFRLSLGLGWSVEQNLTERIYLRLTARPHKQSPTCFQCFSLPISSIILSCLTYNTFSSFASLIGGDCVLLLLGLWPSLPVSNFSGNLPLFVSVCLTNDNSDSLHKPPLQHTWCMQKPWLVSVLNFIIQIYKCDIPRMWIHKLNSNISILSCV